MRQSGQHRRTLWYALGGLLLILAIAQADEHRRFEAAQKKYRDIFAARVAEIKAVMEQHRELLRSRQAIPETRFAALPPPPSPDRLLIRRLRRSFCLTAFALATSMPFVWLLSSSNYAWRNRRLIAEVMLTLALFGTVGMMMGVGHWRNWNRFNLHHDAAGYGLILIPLGVAAVLLARHLDRRVAAGRCPQCDYDLHGNVSGVCPECGTPVTDLSSPAKPS